MIRGTVPFLKKSDLKFGLVMEVYTSVYIVHILNIGMDRFPDNDSIDDSRDVDNICLIPMLVIKR